MSLSQTQRPVALTEAQRAAAREAARRARFVDEVVPTMLVDLHRRTAALAQEGALPAAQRLQIERQLATSQDVGTLRAVAAQLLGIAPAVPVSSTSDAATQSGVPAPVKAGALPDQAGIVTPQVTPTSLRGTAARQSTIAAHASALVVDQIQLTAELAALTRAAANLHVPVTPVARDQLAAAGRALDAADPAVAAVHVAAARTAIDQLESVVDDALAAAEQQALTLNAVTAALEDMGFTVTGVVAPEGADTGAGPRSVVEAEAADGRTAAVALTRDGVATVVDAIFADHDDALPEGAEGADELCTAAHDALGFHQRLEAVRGLSLGPVVAQARPSRANGGLAEPTTSTSSVTRRARRRANPTNPTNQTRSTS